MSDYNVSLVNDSLQEFIVTFKGPIESMSLTHPPSDSHWKRLPQPHLLEAYGRSTSSFQTNIHSNRLVSGSWTRYSIQTSMNCVFYLFARVCAELLIAFQEWVCVFRCYQSNLVSDVWHAEHIRRVSAAIAEVSKPEWSFEWGGCCFVDEASPGLRG